ncbi:MAG: homoserine dehydrogenase [Gemmatimonadota bacterium]|nr:MAG: homoserine dehydrogenase [Gemmatimonadota bacterium]
MKHNLALVGFGVVGQGLVEILIEKAEDLKKRHGFDYSVVAVSDIQKGSVYDEKGLEIQKLLSLVAENGNIEGYPRGIKGWDSLKTITESNADIIVELSFTNIETGEPAMSHFKAAFETGKHLVTTNKGPVALAYKELAEMAEEKGVQFRIEGTVMSGTPVVNLATLCLAGNDIREIRGILNGTTNYILTEMEKGQSYEAALKQAQELGYAEAVPDADVEGWDALAKVLILSNVVMGGALKVSDVEREGITKITLEDIRKAKDAGKRWKLIGQTRKENGSIKAKVSPEMIPTSDPLAGVGGATNALTFDTDLLGQVTVVGAGAGKRETGYSVLTDLLDIHRTLKK